MKLRQAKKLLNGRMKWRHDKGRWVYVPTFMESRTTTAERCRKVLRRHPELNVRMEWFWDVFWRVIEDKANRYTYKK